MSDRAKLSSALKLISKMKNLEIKHRNKELNMHENQKEAIGQLNQISQFQRKMMKYTAPSKGMV